MWTGGASHDSSSVSAVAVPATSLYAILSSDSNLLQNNVFIITTPHALSFPPLWSLFPDCWLCLFLLLFQVMLLGDSSVGKTCLLVRFKDGAFLGGNFIATVGIDFRVRDAAAQPQRSSSSSSSCSLCLGVFAMYVWSSHSSERSHGAPLCKPSQRAAFPVQRLSLGLMVDQVDLI